MKKLCAIFLVALFVCSAANSQESQKKEGKKQFVYVLKLVPRLLNEKNWTEQDNSIVGKHFRRLQQLHKEGKVILAGRTLNESEKLVNERNYSVPLWVIYYILSTVA